MYFAIGCAVGLMLGLTGAGGSIVAVPLLILFTPLVAAEAMGLSLGAVFVAAVYGCLLQHRQLPVLGRMVSIFIVGGAIATPLGRWAAYDVPEPLLLIGFMSLAIAIAVLTWFRADALAQVCVSSMMAEIMNEAGVDAQPGLKPGGQSMPATFVYSLGIGFVSGLFGVGGGFLIVPVLVHRLKLPVTSAVPVSIWVIAFFSGTGFFTQLILSGSRHLLLLIYLAVGSVVGMLCSQFVRPRLREITLQKFFSVTLLLVSIITMVSRLI